MSEQNEILCYADSYRSMARQGTVNVSVWSVITDLERNMAPILAASKQREAALQQRLTAADERADLLEGLLRRVVESAVLICEQDLTEAMQSLEAEICAALKPAECCTVSAEDRALLNAGDYTPEELFGVGGKPSCPKCAS